MPGVLTHRWSTIPGTGGLLQVSEAQETFPVISPNTLYPFSLFKASQSSSIYSVVFMHTRVMDTTFGSREMCSLRKQEKAKKQESRCHLCKKQLLVAAHTAFCSVSAVCKEVKQTRRLYQGNSFYFCSSQSFSWHICKHQRVFCKNLAFHKRQVSRGTSHRCTQRSRRPGGVPARRGLPVRRRTAAAKPLGNWSPLHCLFHGKPWLVDSLSHGALRGPVPGPRTRPLAAGRLVQVAIAARWGGRKVSGDGAALSRSAVRWGLGLREGPRRAVRGRRLSGLEHGWERRREARGSSGQSGGPARRRPGFHGPVWARETPRVGVGC